MPEWIDFAVYAVFTASVWGYLSTATPHWMLRMIVDRNPEWMTTHPECRRRLRHGWSNRFCLLWGALSLATLAAFHAGAWPQPIAFGPTTPKWEALKDLHAVLLIGGGIVLVSGAGFFVRWLHRRVPLAARREATLEPRSIQAYVPVAFQYGTYGLVTLHLGLWVAAGVAGRYDTPAFWGTMAFQFAVAGVFFSFSLRALRRRPGALDRAFGPGYRRGEVRVAFAAQVLALPNGAARLYEQVANTRVETLDRGLQLLLIVLMLSGLALVALWARHTARPSSDSIESMSW